MKLNNRNLVTLEEYRKRQALTPAESRAKVAAVAAREARQEARRRGKPAHVLRAVREALEPEAVRRRNVAIDRRNEKIERQATALAAWFVDMGPWFAALFAIDPAALDAVEQLRRIPIEVRAMAWEHDDSSRCVIRRVAMVHVIPFVPEQVGELVGLTGETLRLDERSGLRSAGVFLGKGGWADHVPHV